MYYCTNYNIILVGNNQMFSVLLCRVLACLSQSDTVLSKSDSVNKLVETSLMTSNDFKIKKI